MSHKHEHEHCHHGIHVCLKVAKLVVSAAGVAAAFCMAKELHRVHRAIEERHEQKHHHKLL